ncbi:glycoside hydrolase family 43 protein [Salininema proteolyticum]|uniref:Family 43 glycosylhydrolase n=1 Tax=Salininema proteolyticum TaxID=1607685 RepID=A0ABV8TVC1_9ACTN
MGLKRRTTIIAAGSLAALAAGTAHAAPGNGKGDPPPHAGRPGRGPRSLANPLVTQRADPHIVAHEDGFYYFTATVPEYDRIILRRSRTISGLAGARETVIWNRHSEGEMGAHIWAPELHYVDGAWYIHFAAGATDDIWRIRMYVLRNTNPNPLAGTWEELGQIVTPWDSFSLDATTFEHNGTRYLCWAQHLPELDNNTSLLLAPMDTPSSIADTPIEISRPELPWETVRYQVNEGAYAVHRNGRLFLTYSASGTGAEYCMGLLTADEDADLMDPVSWHKAQEPVFATSDANGVYGPGHSCFTVDEEGHDVLVYHARQYREIDGDPLNDPNRHTRVQRFGWNQDGTPDFGEPVPDGPLG